MIRLEALPVALALGLAFAGTANAKTVKVDSCQLAAVQSAVSAAAAEDVIEVPAGHCTWTGTLAITKPVTLSGSGQANDGPSQFGAGATSTVITDAASGSLISVSGLKTGEVVRISLFDIEPTPSTAVGWPMVMSGTCSAVGCPSFRLDNIVWGKTTPWTYQPVLLTQTLVSTDNIFGVVDHNTVSPGSFDDRSPEFININHTSWQGVGAFGDKSWASPDTFGTDEAVYLENNDIWLSENPVTENEFPVNGGTVGAGGGRMVGRFNHFTMSGAGPFAYHGTETSGRSRSGRSFEVYGNALSCVSSACNVYVGFRGGTGFVFGNTWTLGANTWINSILNIETQRTWRGTDWSQCNGLTPFDVNDEYAKEWSGTIGSISGSGPYTINVSGTPWTSGALAFDANNPGSKFYVVWDETAGWMGGIESNTASTATTNFAISATPFPGTAMSAGDKITIYSSKLYAAGKHSGASGASTLTDGAKSWTANEWVGQNHGYSVIDLTQGGLSNQIGANTSNTITPATADCCPAWTWNQNDEYVIAGYSACLDQGGAGLGQLYANDIPTPVAATTETLDPAYEWDNAGDLTSHPNIGTDSPSTFAPDVQYYTDNSGGNPVACSSAHPCASLESGVAFGKLAYRPKTCKTGVGYFAVDQGSWNQSGNDFGQGELFVCGAGNTWHAHYEPYCYPHPLASGRKCGSGLPDGGAPSGSGGGGAGGAGSGGGGSGGDKASSGCGCELASTSAKGGAFAAAALLGCLWVFRRTRRRRRGAARSFQSSRRQPGQK